MKNIIIGILLTFCLQGYSQQPIFATFSGGDLYKVNLTNCTSTFVGSTGQGFGDIAFTQNGKLWGIVSGDLYQIDTLNGNASLVGSTGVGAVSLVGLNDTTLLAEYNMCLYGINNNTGVSYYIDTIGYQAAGDLTWYDNDLYLTTPAQLVRITLNASNSAIISVDTVNSFNNAIPTCEGVATASFIGDYNSIIGFSGPNAYKICQIDGSYQMLCPSLLAGGTPGAACLRLPIQNPLPPSCSKIGIAENSSLIGFKIYPNPTKQNAILEFNNSKNEDLVLRAYDRFGLLVYTLEIHQSNLVEIERNNLSAGLYYFQLWSKTNIMATARLIFE